MKFIKFELLWGTFAVMIYDKHKSRMNNYFIQFSFKDIWLIPHKEHIKYPDSNDSWCAGWLVFYFGNVIAYERKVIDV